MTYLIKETRYAITLQNYKDNNYIEEFEGDVNLYTLKDLHLTCNDIKISAKQWLEKQEFWVKLFLANNCSFNENREALNILAKK